MRIAVFGAGATGCYLGGVLALAGCEVTLIARKRIQQEIERSGGIGLSHYSGRKHRVAPQQIVTQVSELENQPAFDLIFITLKCHQLDDIVNDLIQISNEKSQLIFMQNGLGSLAAVSDRLSGRRCFQGITSFNVLAMDEAIFHQGTEGEFIFAKTPELSLVTEHVNQEHSYFELSENIEQVIYGKLLLNLNNAINAIADLPLKQELEQRQYRKVLSAAMSEWIAIAKAKGVILAQFTKVKPHVIPWLLRLPDSLFKLLAKQMLMIDPLARSSMWQDIQDGKRTEIDYLNGAVVKLGQELSIDTPVNEKIVEAIAQLEQGKQVDFNSIFGN